MPGQEKCHPHRRRRLPLGQRWVVWSENGETPCKPQASFLRGSAGFVRTGAGLTNPRRAASFPPHAASQTHVVSPHAPRVPATCCRFLHVQPPVPPPGHLLPLSPWRQPHPFRRGRPAKETPVEITPSASSLVGWRKVCSRGRDSEWSPKLRMRLGWCRAVVPWRVERARKKKVVDVPKMISQFLTQH
jgi:hypothetical protein